MHAVVQNENDVRLPISAIGAVSDRANDSTIERLDRGRYDLLDENVVEDAEDMTAPKTPANIVSIP